MIIIPKLLLGYQHTPKIASTSLLSWFYTILYGRDFFAGDATRNVHDYFLWGNSADITTIANQRDSVAAYQGYLRFAVTRDPVKRFLSMYGNRVMHHRELSSAGKAAELLRKEGVPFDPEINVLVEKLHVYASCEPSIAWHTRPQMDFLGPDLSVYSDLVDIRDVGGLIERIKEHWLRAGRSDLLQRATTNLGRSQAGGPKLGLDVLTPESFERLMEYYQEDYAKLPTISARDIREEYREARMASAGELLNTPDDPGHTALRHAGGRYALSYCRKGVCPSLREVWIAAPEPGDASAGRFNLTGIVLLASPESPRGWRLVAADANGERICDWGLPSPRLAEKHPDHPLAGNARFLLEGVTVREGRPVTLYLRSDSGEEHELLRIEYIVNGTHA
jgi:Sulfotransferase family